MMLRLPMVLFLSLNVDIINGQGQKNALGNEVIPSTTKASSRLYNPHYGYEPYWPGGDWVGGADMPTTLSTSTKVQLCGEDCPDNYSQWQGWKDLGIAGEYPNRWRCGGRQQFPEDIDSTYETLQTYCHYLAKMCNQVPQGPRFKYTFVHLGKCLEKGFNNKHDVNPEIKPYAGETWLELFQTHFDWGKHLQRADFWEEGVRERIGMLKQTPFVPHRWPSTTPVMNVDDNAGANQQQGAGPPGPPGPPGPLGPPGPPGIDPNPPFAPSNPPGWPKLRLREGVSEQKAPALSLEAWQDYLRVLR